MEGSKVQEYVVILLFDSSSLASYEGGCHRQLPNPKYLLLITASSTEYPKQYVPTTTASWTAMEWEITVRWDSLLIWRSGFRACSRNTDVVGYGYVEWIALVPAGNFNGHHMESRTDLLVSRNPTFSCSSFFRLHFLFLCHYEYQSILSCCAFFKQRALTS